MIRLAKYIADAGVCSRRQASRLIESGCVLVNGRQGLHIDRIKDGDRVFVNSQEVQANIKKIYFLYNKPVGIDSVCDFSDPSSIVHHLPELKDGRRVFPVGRLDKDSHGLMLLTNHGELCQKLMHPDFYHEKEYLVRVDWPLSDDFLVSMTAGVQYGEVTTKPCRIKESSRNNSDISETQNSVRPELVEGRELRARALCQASFDSAQDERSPDSQCRNYLKTIPKKVEEEWFKITLTQGLNRQIRRMCQALGYRVMDLQRVRMVNLQLDDLALNKHRELTEDEVSVLLRETNHQ